MTAGDSGQYPGGARFNLERCKVAWNSKKVHICSQYTAGFAPKREEERKALDKDLCQWFSTPRS